MTFEFKGKMRSTPCPKLILRTVKLGCVPPLLAMTSPSNAWRRSLSPSLIFTCTRTVSPGRNCGKSVRRVLAISRSIIGEFDIFLFLLYRTPHGGLIQIFSSSLSFHPERSEAAGRAQSKDLLFLARVIARAHEVQRNIRLVANNPTVVPRRNIEHISGMHFDDTSVIHGRSSHTRNNHADMFHLAALRARGIADVFRPLPARLIAGPANRHPAQFHQLKLALLEQARLIGLLKAFQDRVYHGIVLSTSISASSLRSASFNSLSCNRSGRFCKVFSKAFRRRQRRISSWFPFIRTSGTAMPRYSAGRV